MKPIKGYLTTCEYVVDRTADYEALKIRKAFEVSTDESDGNGNLCSELIFNAETKRPEFSKTMARQMESIGFYKALPAALLMYRLACLFPGKIDAFGQDGYKVVWQYRLRHKETGEALTFGEWKGGALFWTRFHGSDETPETFKRDLLALLALLVSDNCPHPYDGLVAGSVA